MKSFELFSVILAFVFSTLLMFFTTALAILLISQLTPNFEELMLLLSFLLAVAGYVGIIMLLMGKLTTHPKALIALLLSGVLSFVIFMWIEGGMRAWEWMITMEEPLECVLLLWPILVSIYFSIKAMRNLKTR